MNVDNKKLPSPNAGLLQRNLSGKERTKFV